jgi:thioredoxin-related protein
MESQPDNRQNQEQSQNPANLRKTGSRRPLITIIVVFVAFVTFVMIKHEEKSINWITDYQAGVELAGQQNKPMLIAFHKQFTQYCTLITQNTYPDERVIKYVHDNFIPIYIDIEKQPDLAEQFKIGYYPTHYVKWPDSEELYGPHTGHDVPKVFIEKIERMRKESER